MFYANKQNLVETNAEQICTNSKNGACITNIKRCDLFRRIRWLMWFTAVRPIPFEAYVSKRWSGYSWWLNVALELFLLLATTHVFVLYIFTFYISYSDIEQRGDMGFFISCFIQLLLYSWAIMIKIFFRRIRPDLVYDIMDHLNAEHAIHSAVGFTFVSMQECLSNAEKGLKIFLTCCFSGSIFWLFLPIVYGERTLPLPCWYPFDYKSPYIYTILYFLQSVAQLQLAATFAISSAYFVLLCFLLCGQFDILNCSLKNVVAITYILSGADKAELIKLRDEQRIAEDVVNQYFVAKEMCLDLDCIAHLRPTITDKNWGQAMSFRAAFHRALAPCVHHQHFILNSLRKIEQLYSFVWYLKCLEVTLAVCTIAFDVVKSTTSKSFLEVLSLCQYMILVLWEMFMICYGGDIVYVNSQRSDEALLRSPWYLHACEMRADLLFFVMHAQRAFMLTGAKFYPLTLDKFKQIITTSFSFFTLLQNMDARN